MSIDTLAFLLRRADDAAAAAPACASGNEYDGAMGLRVSAIFVMLCTSSFGALFPIIANNNKSLCIPSWAFFFSKYFGSGVIVATGFIHVSCHPRPPLNVADRAPQLLTPANEALTNPCLTGVITEYPWAQGIALMSVFTLFFVELLAMR